MPWILLLSLVAGLFGPALPAQGGTLRKEISVREVFALHSWLKHQDFFKVVYGLDGCYSRASVASFILDTEKNIHTQLVWLHGCQMIPHAYWNADLQAGWLSHVAPLVRVRTSSGRLQNWVMDPSFRVPLPVRSWLRRLNVTEPLNLAPEEAMVNPPPFRCIYTTTERYQHLSPRGLSWKGWKADHLFHHVQMLEAFVEWQATLVSNR